MFEKEGGYWFWNLLFLFVKLKIYNFWVKFVKVEFKKYFVKFCLFIGYVIWIGVNSV